MPPLSRHNRNGSEDMFPFFDGGADFGRIDPSRSDAVIENATDDGSETEETPHYVGRAVGERALRGFFAALALLLIIVLTRAAIVQIAKNDYYVRLAEDNRSRIAWLPAKRGIMYDRNGTPLVSNVPNFSVTVTPADLPADPGARQDALIRLADVLGVQPIDIERQLDAFKKYPTTPVTVADDVDHTQAILAEILSSRVPAIALAVGTRRDYLASAATPSLSHVLGFEGRVTQDDLDHGADAAIPNDLVGRTGLEKFYDDALRGVYGKRRIEVDAAGHAKNVIAEDDGVPGRNLTLSIDLDLQKFAENAFRSELRAIGKTRGAVIVMNPKTGEILALVSEPSFDDNLFAQGISAADYQKLANNNDRPLFDRAVSGLLPAGSTFKLVVSSAALAEHVVTATTTVLSTGGIHVDKWFFPDWKAGGHGITNVTKALAESVNTFFYYVGGGYQNFQGLGVDRIVAYAKKFGLGSTLGIDLPNEAAGFLPTKAWKETTKGEQWYIGDTYHLAIGQGDLLVTPLQIANVTAAVANGGTLMRPRLVIAETTAGGATIEHKPEVINPQVVDKGVIDIVRKGMRQAVTSGSARSLGDLPVAVAAKTGTAQWNSAKATHAWFTSFAPYDDPQLVVTVLIEEGGEGSSVSAPVAKAIYAHYFSR